MAKPLLGGRRSTIEILFEILSACGNGGRNKTAIMYRCNLSYDQLVRYLTYMCSQELLVKGETGYFEVTARGQEAFDHVAGVIRILLDLHGNEGGESRRSEERVLASG